MCENVCDEQWYVEDPAYISSQTDRSVERKPSKSSLQVASQIKCNKANEPRYVDGLSAERIDDNTAALRQRR